MSYIGGGPYYAEPCPECGEILWNGRCENPNCVHHWHPKVDEDENGNREEDADFENGVQELFPRRFPD